MTTILEYSMRELIKSWTLLDIEVEKLQSEIEELRNKRANNELQIINYMNKNGMSQNVFTVDKFKLSLANENVYTHLSYTFIEKALTSILNDSQQAKIVCNKIKALRNKTVNTYIKRRVKDSS